MKNLRVSNRRTSCIGPSSSLTALRARLKVDTQPSATASSALRHVFRGRAVTHCRCLLCSAGDGDRMSAGESLLGILHTATHCL